MKTSCTEKSVIKINKKLSLKKELISKLNCLEMTNVTGGKPMDNESCYHGCTSSMVTLDAKCL